MRTVAMQVNANRCRFGRRRPSATHARLPFLGVPVSRRGRVTAILAVSFWIGAVVGAVLGVAAPSGALTSEAPRIAWRVVPSPNPPAANPVALSSVACKRMRRCQAVGTAVAQRVTSAFAESWNGARWSLARLPLPRGDSTLGGVACTEADRCFTVGTSTTTSPLPLIERFDGRRWRIVKSPAVRGGSLSGVACLRPADCWAVGSRSSGVPSSSLIEHFGGQAWRVLPSPDVAGNLNKVACLDAKDCWAVGDNGSHTLAVHWNGLHWRVFPTPDASGAVASHLTGVACSRPSVCWAVGYSEGATEQALIEAWNGRAWRVVASPSPPGAKLSVLDQAACSTPSTCFASGFFNTPERSHPLVERWDGVAWTPIALPVPRGFLGATLGGIACPGKVVCQSVGERLTASGGLSLVMVGHVRRRGPP